MARALVAVDKLDKIGVDGVIAELERRGVGADAAARIAARVRRVGAAPPTRREFDCRALRARAPRRRGQRGRHGARGTSREIVRRSAVAPAPARTFALDPSLARGLSYYTGAIFEIAVPDLAGSLGGGGRYDNLVGMFLGQAVPACGFSLGLERILVVMTERGMFPADVTAQRR